MGLILSIPQKVKADETYYTVSSSTPISISTKLTDTSSRSYNFDFNYLDPEGEYPIPSGTTISFSALTYVVQAMQKGNVTLFASQGVAMDWAVSDTFSILWTTAMWTGDLIDLVKITPHQIDYYIVSYDSNWVTYRFEKFGLWVDITLTPSGDFTYTDENGRTEHVSNIRHHSATEDLVGKAIQEQLDPTAQKINTPYIGFKSFGDLDPPYIKGNSLYFFIYDNQQNKTTAVVPDFRDTVIYSVDNSVKLRMIKLVGDPTTMKLNIGNQTNVGSYNSSFRVAYDGLHGQEVKFQMYDTYLPNYTGSGSDFSMNLPVYWSSSAGTVYSPNTSGWLNGNRVSGSGDIYLETITYSDIPAQYRPEVPLELPIPTDQIIIYPETELPQQPDGTPVQPDPLVPEDPIDVPGIPVNPTPPIYRPLPSIVSGNDDLWPSVVELENIEIDLGGYISGLDEYEFPDLSSITSSFSGAIVWVSTIMSTLFNGSDFSILFAVLSSFFIVAALLGLYKWWNHK